MSEANNGSRAPSQPVNLNLAARKREDVAAVARMTKEYEIERLLDETAMEGSATEAALGSEEVQTSPQGPASA